MITVALTKVSSMKTRREKLRQAMNKQLIAETKNAKGRGLVALADFAAGEIIAPIDGVHSFGGEELFVGEDEYAFVCERGNGHYRKTDPVVQDLGWHVANYSCSPNARLSTFLRAERRIAKDDEISVYYGWSTDRAAETRCLCGVPHCYGTIGPRVRSAKTDDEAVVAWREYVDAMIVNRNAQALVFLHDIFSDDWLRAVIETEERAKRGNSLLERMPRLYDYQLSSERIETMSF